MAELDDPRRFAQLQDVIARKPALRALYREVYERFADCLRRCPAGGIALELGSGGGFTKEVLPEVTTSDVIPYAGVDRVVDATKMGFPDASLRFIGLQNVLHHIPDAEAFFREADRCLKPGGRVLIVDQYPGLFSAFIYRHLHHEPFHPEAREWKFDSTGPLSGANGALAWMVFERDRALFEERFPRLRIARVEPRTPLRYWLSGGLKAWSLLPGSLFAAATMLDESLLRISPRLASFVDVELEKRA
jgi:SAM-dependent methyltransferase